MLTQWYSKLADLFGEKNDIGVALSSPTLAEANRFFKIYPLAELLPYESYDADSELYYNRQSVGFILETQPLLGANEETITLLNSLIADSLPVGAVFQVLLWASPHIHSRLDEWSALREHQGETIQTLAKWRSNYLSQGRLRALTSNSHDVLRDFRLIISVSFSTENNALISETLMRFREEIIHHLRSLSLVAKPLAVKAFLDLLREWVNPNLTQEEAFVNYDPHKSLSLQIAAPETQLHVTSHGLCFNEGAWDVRCFHVRDFPTHWAQWGMRDLIGDMYRETLRIPCPFLISVAIHRLNDETSQRRAMLKGIRADQQAQSPMARFMPSAQHISQDWKSVNTRLTEGERLVECTYQVILYAPQDQGNLCEALLKNLYNAKGWKLAKPRYLQLPSWLSSLPMLLGEGFLEDFRRLGHMKTMLSQNAANILPLQGEWKGTQIPRMLLTGRRGQLLGWDNFSNLEGNYNVAVVGKSGSGKSVFMQEMMTSLLGTGGRVWVLDVGRSFQKTCELLQGEFMAFTPDSTLCINPFTFIEDFEEALAMLKPLLAMMAKPNAKTSDHENALLEQVLKSAWEEKHQDACVTTVAKHLLAHEDTRANDLGTMLFPYTKAGMYGRFFEGRCTLNVQCPLTVLELEELKSKKDLQAVVLLTLMYQVTEAMYRGNREQPMICIIDEAWDLLRGAQSGEFVETGCRRARKYRGAFITGTQSINDYYKTPAAQAAFENSDWVCLLSQKPESIDELKERKRLPVDGHVEHLLKSIKTIQGQYAEILIYGPSGYAVGRLMLDPFSRVMYSSRAEDFAAVKRYQAEGLSLAQAIEQVAKALT
jgi:conjugal transfer ATP-binding protein TraC